MENRRLPTLNLQQRLFVICDVQHCAVGYTLQPKDPNALPLDLLIKRLDEISTLRSFSITGGEPMLSNKSVQNYVLPLLKYAQIVACVRKSILI